MRFPIQSMSWLMRLVAASAGAMIYLLVSAGEKQQSGMSRPLVHALRDLVLVVMAIGISAVIFRYTSK